MDTGECSTIGFSHYVFSLFLRKCRKEQRYAGNTEMGAVIQGPGYGIRFFTYTPVSPARLIFWLDDEVGEKRASEGTNRR